MLSALTKLLGGFGEQADAGGEADRQHAIQVATALLLIEIARADFSEDLTENRTILQLLIEFFELSQSEAESLVDQARAEADHAASLQAFTRQLHAALTDSEKHAVVEMLWKVALADEHLDKHEDHLIRKVAALLYVRHADLIRIRNRVRQS